ncbi:MAG: hypothetical protein KGI73_00450 [Patescibacteria group bacterium]|nr:hypothetical protein [Patescibacteria group bacterium]
MKHSRFAVFAAAALFAAMPLFASAADIEYGQSLIIPLNQAVTQNMYLAAKQVNFLTTAQKDLVAAGGELTVNGPVWGDALLAGGIVQVLQEVRGDVRAAGAQVEIGNSVRGDLILFGNQLDQLAGTVVGGDAIMAGNTVDIEGTINGSARIYGNNVIINGTIAGPVIIRASHSVTFGDKAVLGSTLWYTAPQEASVASSAKIGNQVTYVKKDAGAAFFGNTLGMLAALIGVLAFAKFLAFLVGALVLVLAWRRAADALVADTLGAYWKMAGIGLVAFIVAPVVTIALAFTLIGFYLALMVGAFYILLLLASGVYMCVEAGALLSLWIRKHASTDWRWTVLGVIVVFVIALIPLIGWIADVILFFAALGTLVRRVYATLKKSA